MEHPSDEMIGPTRGTDWSDFGVWRQLHAHTWDPSHAQLINTWNHLNSGIFRASQVVESSAATAQEVAEAKFLRAYFMHYVMDFFGQDRKSTRLNSSHVAISYAVFCLKKKKMLERL